MHPSRVVPGVALALALGSVTAGCGSTDSTGRGTDETAVSAADRACREQWHELSNEVGAKSARGVTVRRAFESRWESIGAGIGYYESTARSDQCGDLLTAQRTSIRDVDAVVDRALSFDIERRAIRATAARKAWRAQHPRAKEPRAVRRAYRTLQAKVPRATRDIAPAMTELAGIDPARSKAVKRGLRDVALLASASDAYVACYQALFQVHVFVDPPKRKPDKPKKNG
jgi:hypothetical protein